MQKFDLIARDQFQVACYEWLPANPKAIVVIAHGMGEHAQRYDWTARELVEAGYAVFAKDHRGHGDTTHAGPGDMGADGWSATLVDIHELVVEARRRVAAEVPLILFGHSMGAMLSQQYVTAYGQSVDALVLSGSPGIKPRSAGWIMKVLVGIEKWRHGAGAHSEFLQDRLFGNANEPFDSEDATGYEWLSRDAQEVQKYVVDEGCGFVLSCGSLLDMARGSSVARSSQALADIPKELPVYVFSGEDDPVHGEKADIERLITLWRGAGVQNIDLKWYAGGRHEMLNEVNKQEVVRDLIDWLDQHV